MGLAQKSNEALTVSYGSIARTLKKRIKLFAEQIEPVFSVNKKEWYIDGKRQVPNKKQIERVLNDLLRNLDKPEPGVLSSDEI